MRYAPNIFGPFTQVIFEYEFNKNYLMLFTIYFTLPGPVFMAPYFYFISQKSRHRFEKRSRGALQFKVHVL